MNQFIDWKEVRSIFQPKLKVVYIVLPRQTGKSKILVDSFVEDIGSQILITMNSNMVRHLQQRVGEYFVSSQRRQALERIGTLSFFERKMHDGLFDIKRILVDEFVFMETRQLFEFLKTMVSRGTSEIIAVTTLRQRMNKTQFEDKFCVFNNAEYTILTVDDLDLCVPLERLKSALKINGPEIMETECVTGGII